MTHHLFRFPAKFHAPVVAHLLKDYTQQGDTVLDPFCGSGTLMVEAAISGRHSVGLDVDPLSVFISRAKTQALDTAKLSTTLVVLLEKMATCRRPIGEYEVRQWSDLDDEAWSRQSAALFIPPIPNLLHWFRRYVVVDLARMLQIIDEHVTIPAERRFFRLVFASCLRNASNADPVPVSGLEVTKHMRALDATGRLIDPYALFERRARRSIKDMEQFAGAKDSSATVRCRRVDTSANIPSLGAIDAVVTSPPYHGAVDYYRRHQLEHYWLGLVENHADRLALLDSYLGRPKVPARHRYISKPFELPEWAADVEATIAAIDDERARAFRHYCVGMSRSLRNIAKTLAPQGRAVFVVGHSRWKDTVIDTSRLFSELAQGALHLVERRSYPVRNRYMSYERHNGASIDEEFVLVYESAGSG